MTMNETERFEQAQRDRLIELRALVADKAAHAEFLAILEDAAPGEIFDDLPLPKGVARKVADAIIADFEWIVRPAPPQGTQTGPFPCAYSRLRAKQNITSARGARTRETNATWAGFNIGGK